MSAGGVFSLLIINAEKVTVETFDDLELAVRAYRRHAIEIQERLERTPQPKMQSVANQMRQAIGMMLFAPNWTILFQRTLVNVPRELFA